MYIANRRDISKCNGCSPRQIHHGLTTKIFLFLVI